MPDDLHTHLSDMLSAARAKSGEELLAFSVDQVIRGAGPRQAEVLRRCAVPRWLDPGVLRILRGKDEGNERVLEKLRDYSFVRELGDGRLAYHDQVRQALLAEWRRERPEELRALHLELYRYFRARTTPPGSSRRATPLMPESKALSAVPMSVQADLFRREAIYHLLQADPARGAAELRAAFEELEEAHRLAEAELILQTADDAELDGAARRRLTYMRARLLRGGMSLETATRAFEALRADPELEPGLGAEVARSLGEVYAETGQWARATELYRGSLAQFQQAGDARASAETMLLLGEAYQALGVSTGSWHVPSPAPHPLLQLLHAAWVWLLGLPFRIAALLPGVRRALPLPEYCARYQNWLLIRLYNTARGWFEQARAAFERLGDPVGTLRAEQRLADIQLLYGYHDEARARLEELMRRPEARDQYRKAWLQRSLADCYLAAGNVGSAEVLLAEALALFRELGDVRREASIRMLQGRAAMQAGDVEGALQGYRDGLDRYRELGYAAARERILHELRAWQRGGGASPGLRARIAAIVAAEPEKRYVGRFIRSALPLLQIGSLLALPLAMLLLAVLVPNTELRALGDVGGVLTVNATFPLWRTALVIAALVPLYLVVYAALALAVIYLLPIAAIEREQPDVIVTRPQSIARYDSHGTLEYEMPWASVRRWLALDRCLWVRPLPLYSRTYLEDEAGYDLGIDGITGWYSEVQQDVGRRLQAAGATVRREDLGYSLLKSGMGVSAVLGALLVALITAAENNWLPLAHWLPAPVYAALAFLSLSGALILVPVGYWVASRPLRLKRTLLLTDRWPLLLGLVGLGLVLTYLLRGGDLIPGVKALSYGLFVWGAYLFGEALVAGLAPGRRGVRVPVVLAAVLAAAAAVALPAYGSYQWLVAYTAKEQVVATPTPAAAAEAASSCGAAEQARELGADTFTSYLFQGDCAAGLAVGLAGQGDARGARGQWAAAAGFYAQAYEWAATPAEQALALFNLARAAEGAERPDIAGEAERGYRELCARYDQAAPVCRQIFSRQ